MPKWNYVYTNTVEAETEQEAIEQISEDLMDEAQSPRVIGNSMEEMVDDDQPRCQRCNSRLY